MYAWLGRRTYQYTNTTRHDQVMQWQYGLLANCTVFGRMHSGKANIVMELKTETKLA